ncbi:MAG: glycogen-binding domain-containing protein [Desulfobulbus sp.]|nr:glycogen-binding domain-containing protein [Desulfobulbus sp.]
MNNDYLISLYIDNELDLDEKISFVETIHVDTDFTEETLTLLQQEKRLHVLPPHQLPEAPPVIDASLKPSRFYWSLWWKPLAGLAVAGALASLMLLLPPARSIVSTEPYRFVLYLPGTQEAKIIGTFTDWHPVAMAPVGKSGYWTLTLAIPEGEHRYSYLIGKDKQIADPTVTLREQDDFGGENSVLEVRRTAI